MHENLKPQRVQLSWNMDRMCNTTLESTIFYG
jgi:hypothetical protein